MGQWNRRYRGGGRRKYYNYEEPPPSPPRTQPLPYGRSENGVPSWEIDFCYLSGVTWHKISTGKKFMRCHDTVLNWNDLGGEEAYQNAKRRYWEKINGIPCEDSPDPDMYIGEVDWDSHIDPELMVDIDRTYFNPDDEGRRNKFNENSKEANSYSLARNDKYINDGGNPWDSNIAQGARELKSSIDPWEQYVTDAKNTNKEENTWENNPIQGTREAKTIIDPWEQYCSEKKPINKGENPWESNAVQGTGTLKSHADPWEQYCTEVGQSINKNAWRDSVDESSLWKRGQSQNMQSSPHICGTQHQQRAGYTQTKGHGYATYNSWSSNQNAASNDRPWRDCGNNSERKFSEYSNDDWGRSGFRGQNRGGREGYDGCRKREGSMQHDSRNKSIRFQANDYGTSYRWRN